MNEDEMIPGQETAAPAKCIEIEMASDGSFKVYECEPKGEAPGEAESAGESYQSMDEALQAAAKLLTNDTRTEADQQMAGYSKGAKKPEAGRMPLAQVFGE